MHVCMCGVHACVCMLTVCVFKCTWGLTPGVILIYSSTLFFESGSLNQTQSSPLRLLGGRGLHFPFPELELKAGCYIPLIFMGVLAI